MDLFIRLVSTFGLLVSLASALSASPQVAFIGDGLRYRIEDRPITIDELIQKPGVDFHETHSFQPNMGFKSNAVWFYAKLENPSPSASSIIFEVAYPRLEVVDLYVVNAKGEVVNTFRMGTDASGPSRPIHHLNFAIPLQLEPGQQLQLYMRTLTDNPLRFPVKIWEPETFRASQQSQQLLQGLYYGGIIIMVIYNMFVYIGTRSRSYLFYCVFVSCTAGYLASDGGILLQYVFTESSFLE
ncbi:MAG TPA: 7TM-DISM domain-containing protein [Oligoflexus sp.]|uniref:7TMR-DISM family protein n=1 Tax=Oligoflexus sp. TaxID=1971216 RepID=UPI002D2C6F08|nr:7TM-DISM domain-containing protein [Oligoflexus sp.]HYX39569.1 7TM-DISM domain-containing protein [Oligoflexus sp.]